MKCILPPPFSPVWKKLHPIQPTHSQSITLTMSGSGGFYKYRCKYFYSQNCTNWVYVNGAPCAMCALCRSVPLQACFI
ncbi:hypothetical protein B0T24DRAFT_537182 [Lasiosphaeria ovina]|uniref:Uncharacterized protein n=1 Tax=Lasiosphaeria ovina TaxID=92902 RepID=A0AAE0JVM4_9PEZI|nr:hypothetical protein B0T24DRAFT_537182 [Lasiosphaeria ovina]